MTPFDFINSLPEEGWEIGGLGFIRRQESRECPLCFAARLQTAKQFKNTEWMEAGEAIGLDETTATQIAYATTDSDFPRLRAAMKFRFGL